MAPTLMHVVFVLCACAYAYARVAAPDTADFRIIAAPDGSTFRSDYNYHEAANGWLKVHLIPVSWYKARVACSLEGARLASPLTQGLYMSMMEMQQEILNRRIHTGVHAMLGGDDYYSVEGVHFTEMPIQWAVEEPNNEGGEERCLAMLESGLMADNKCEERHSFICYREKVGSMAMNACGNYDSNYVKSAVTGSCYKHHASPTTWRGANAVCTEEGGHLAIINSEHEAQVLKALALAKQDWKKSATVFLGFFNWYKDDDLVHDHWATLDDISLQEAGYVHWREGEPNNEGGKEQCGSFILKKDSRLEFNDISCDNSAPYICEIEKPRVPLW